VLAGGDVSGNAGDSDGGAVLADLVEVIDVELINNRAVRGGAVSTADLLAVRTSFVGNEAELGDGAGGAVLASVAVVLKNVTFRGNSAKQGGAVRCTWT
jgi:predicted outer membrane repeat protein